MKLRGFDQVKSRLQDLGNKQAKQVSRKALRAGAKVLRSEARSLAPVSPRDHAHQKYESRNHPRGTLRKAIKAKAGVKANGKIRMIVGLGRAAIRGLGFYATFVLFGHKGVAANNFIKRAYDNKKEAALGEITETYRELLDV